MEGFSGWLAALNIASILIMAAYMVHTAKRVRENFAQGRPLAYCKDDGILPPDIQEGIYGGFFVAAAAFVPPFSLSVVRLACVFLFFPLLYRHIRNRDTEKQYAPELQKLFARCKIGGAVVFLCILIRLL